MLVTAAPSSATTTSTVAAATATPRRRDYYANANDVSPIAVPARCGRPRSRHCRCYCDAVTATLISGSNRSSGSSSRATAVRRDAIHARRRPSSRERIARHIRRLSPRLWLFRLFPLSEVSGRRESVGMWWGQGAIVYRKRTNFECGFFRIGTINNGFPIGKPPTVHGRSSARLTPDPLYLLLRFARLAAVNYHNLSTYPFNLLIVWIVTPLIQLLTIKKMYLFLEFRSKWFRWTRF